jgi:hypothetical protein
VRPAGGAVQGGFNTVDRRRALVLVQQTTEDLTKAVDSIKQTTGKIVRQTQAEGLDSAAVNKLLAGGTIDGVPKATLRDLKKLIRTAAVDGKITTVNTSTGVVMNFKPDYYAELVFQTKLAETTNVATIQRLRDKKIFYVKIIGSNSRNFCTAFVGRVFYTGDGEDPLGLFPHVRTLPRGGPPFHPRCTKRYVAFNPRLATPEQIEDAKLRPNERELLGKSSTDAQRAYGNPPAGPDPAPPAGRPVENLPRPAGTPPQYVNVADRFELPKSGALLPTIRASIAQIDKLHRMPAGVRPMPVGVVPNGKFEAQIKLSGGWQMQVKSRTEFPRSSIAHEIGHYFEHQVLGGIGSVVTRPDLAEWRDAVQRTPTFGALYMNWRITGGRYQAYLMQPYEVFARSYAQWVAQRSGDADMIMEVRRIRDGTRPPIQWDYDEFEPIANAFDSLIERLGLKR